MWHAATQGTMHRGRVYADGRICPPNEGIFDIIKDIV